MKYISFLLLFLIFNTNTIAQNKSLIGEWSAINVETKYFNYDVLKDSVTATTELQKIYPDSLSQKEFLKMATKMFKKNQFIFEENGECTQKINDLIIRKIKYKFKEKTNTILMEEGAFGDAKYNFKMKNGILFLSKIDSGHEAQITFEKIDK